MSIPASETGAPAPAGDLVVSLQRGLSILELLAGEPEGLLAKTVSARSGLHISTCYHLLNTLRAAGYVTKHPASQRYMPTGKAWFPARPELDLARLVPILYPHLLTLRDRSGETAYLSLRCGDEIVVSAIVESPQAIKVSLLFVGFRGAAHALALGKAILAYLPDDDVLRYIARHQLPALTANTCRDAADLRRGLALVRQRGYSLDLEEFVPDVCCIGAPIFGPTRRVAASLAISLPAYRYVTGCEGLIAEVREAAAAATHALTLIACAPPEP